MQDTPQQAQERYDQFLKDAIQYNVVWTLRNDEGWAVAGDEGERFVLFWSSETAAEACAKQSYPDYAPVSMPLDEFLEWMLPQLHDSHVFAGVNTLPSTAGISTEPLVLANELREKST